MMAKGTYTIDNIDVPPPPCAACKHVQVCAQQRLACEAFATYAGGKNGTSGVRGKPASKNPHRFYYLHCFPFEVNSHDLPYKKPAEKNWRISNDMKLAEAHYLVDTAKESVKRLSLGGSESDYVQGVKMLRHLEEELQCLYLMEEARDLAQKEKSAGRKDGELKARQRQHKLDDKLKDLRDRRIKIKQS